MILVVMALVTAAIAIYLVGYDAGHRSASRAATQALGEHGLKVGAWGYKQGVTAERARLRAAVNGLVGRYKIESLLDRNEVLALFDEPIAGRTHGEPYAFNCTVPGCTVEGHHR